MKKTSIVFMVAVFIMCLIPTVGLIIFGPGEAGANEVLADRPELTTPEGTPNTAILSDIKNYVDDRFYLRQELITAGRKISAGLFRATGEDDVIIGKNGWLFYGSTLDNFTGAGGLTEREYFAAAKNLSLMNEYCESRGIRFLFTCAPNKNSVYGEFMPNTGVRAERYAAAELYSLLDASGTPYANLHTAFNALDETLYFAHDSHWTSRGAALAADVIGGALGRPSRYFEGNCTPAPHTGDLYEMVYPAWEDSETDLVYTPAIELTYGAGGTRPDSITITAEGSGEGRLFMYRDSFGNNLYPYMADSFAWARFSRSAQYDLTGVDADFLVVELVERNLVNLSRYPPVLPAPERDLELPAQTSGTIRLATGETGLEGYIGITGTLPAGADVDSPVYIQNSAGTFEAALTPDGFSALVPLANGPWTAALYVGGTLTSFEGI